MELLVTTHHENTSGFTKISRILRTFKETRRGAEALLLSLVLASVLHGASVKNYGAVGNVSTDDTTALQRAINATTSGTLTFPAGTYKISNTLTLRSNVTYQGQGQAVLTGAVTIMAMPNNANVITISGLTFNGGQLIGQGVSTNITVTGCTFRNLTLYKTGNWTLRNALFTAGSFRNSSFDHNTFSNILPNGNTRPDGTGNSIGDTNYGM
jgi:polygalacturonase